MNNYNIPSNNRELQLDFIISIFIHNYNIPSNNRELQPHVRGCSRCKIITYQVITGNYSGNLGEPATFFIITYQVITGNYSEPSREMESTVIITYQVITGNYSEAAVPEARILL